MGGKGDYNSILHMILGYRAIDAGTLFFVFFYEIIGVHRDCPYKPDFFLLMFSFKVIFQGFIFEKFQNFF
jgi:hypothetical protein